MSIMKPFRSVALACTALLALTSLAQATTFNSFGTVSGSNTSYTGGERDTWSVDPIPPSPTWLFGNPVITSGNNLSFTPNTALTTKPLNFSVVSSGEKFEDGDLSVQISATNPTTGNIALMSLSENGDYMLQNATAASSAAAILNIAGLVITQVDGGATAIPANGIPVSFTEAFANASGNGTPTISPNSIVYTGNGLLSSGIWTGSANFNIAGALAGAGLAGHRVTGLELDLDNILSVNAEPNAVVSMDKKSFIITTGGFVPEPSSIIMGILGGLGLATAAFRKKFAKTA
ncbi:MAG TPA: hypothetical protein VFE46_05645 [Pirellulales bacterium]|jgi:hypothetical protein|nr:hypothetical protein [Pirellulales bacterium]